MHTQVCSLILTYATYFPLRTLVFHDGIREWFELKTDKPECGQASIQLVQLDQNKTLIEVFRGCRVRSQGEIDYSPTGYYSLTLYQGAREIEPVGGCRRQPPLPDYSGARPDKTVRAYRVDMHVNYEPGDHPIVFRITNAGKELRPWQAYANYLLTGGFVLYGLCGDGFVVDKVFGTSAAYPDRLGDMAMFDPELRRCGRKKRTYNFGYTCIWGH